jgi:cytidine deaminase
VDDAQLRERAADAASRAYAPYSKFRVGAAVLDSSGQVFTGCNVENASYGLTICAERVALTGAMANGAVPPLKTIAVVCLDAKDDDQSTPCGACRQVMAELMPRSSRVLLGQGSEATTVSELLPRAFSLDPEDAQPA